MSSSDSFPSLPAINLIFPPTPLALAALRYTKEHSLEQTVNHCLRSVYFATIIARKHRDFAGKPLNLDIVILALILHDMGWTTTKTLLSEDKRFEVDGANIARAFLEEHAPAEQWDKHAVQTVWDAIALHGTPTIALHKEPEVALAHLGIEADFVGPIMPGGPITEEEYEAVVGLFPRNGFKDHFVGMMCGLCEAKTETTIGNFVGHFGLAFGPGGDANRKDEYRKQWEEGERALQLAASLENLEKGE